MPKTGDILHIGANASVQFGDGRHILFEVTRVLEDETRQTYADWAWLEGFELSRLGKRIRQRQVFVMPAGLQALIPKQPPVNARPIPRPRTSPETTTSGRTR